MTNISKKEKLKKVNNKIEKAGYLSISRLFDNNIVGQYVGAIKLNSADKKFLKDNNLVYVSPNVYKLSYYKTWIISKAKVYK